MLTLSDWNGRTIEVPDYTWDAGVDAGVDVFKCELRDVDIGLIAEAVKGGGDWMSTSPAGSHPHNVDITVCEDQPLVGNTLIPFKCCTWEVWDVEGYNVKIQFQVWGEPNTWKGYEDYVRHPEDRL